MSLKTLTERFEEVNRIKENNKKIDKAVFNIEDVGDLLISYKNLKEMEKSHQEENGKLRVEYEKVYEDNLTLAHELEQYKLLEANIDKANKIIAENKFDEGLYGLLMKEKEKNKTKVDIKDIEFSNFIKERYVSKNKIKEKIEEIKKKGDYRDIYNPTGRVHFMKEGTDYQIEVLEELLEV